MTTNDTKPNDVKTNDNNDTKQNGPNDANVPRLNDTIPNDNILHQTK